MIHKADVEAAHTLAMLALQSERYIIDTEFAQAVEEVLLWTRMYREGRENPYVIKEMETGESEKRWYVENKNTGEAIAGQFESPAAAEEWLREGN